MKQKAFTSPLVVSLFFVLLLFTACEKEVSWPVNGIGEEVIVEGMVTDEYRRHLIRLSKPVTDINAEAEPLSGAEVYISTSDSVYLFKEDTVSPGYYCSEQAFAGIPGTEYNLFISEGSRIITSKATMTEGKDFDILQYSLNSDSLYAITWVADAYTSTEPAMFEVLLNWSDVPGYRLLPKQETTARLLYYSLPTVDVSQIFAPDQEIIKFPSGTLITETRYSLTPSHADFLRALLSETSWQGGLFNTVPAGIPDNISNGTGYFSACGTKVKEIIAR